MHFKVAFHLDGSGIYYDPLEPIHLDALLAWVLAPFHCKRHDLTRDDSPEHVPLPLLQSRVDGIEVWHASALFPEGPQGEGLHYWRCRFRQGRADLTRGSPNLTNGPYRDWNMPVPLTLCTRMVAYASGNRKECKSILRHVRHLGKKRAHGHGRILDIQLDETPEDCSLVKDGRAMRFLPDPRGTRLCRVRPPYWNSVDRVRCCEVGTHV